MIDFDWENIEPNTPDEELYKRYVNSMVLVPNPYIVKDPMLPAPCQRSGNSAATPQITQQPIAATAPMEDGEEPQLYSNSNHVILKASLIKHFLTVILMDRYIGRSNSPNFRRKKCLF
jgi:hypothetical protein